MYWSITQDWHSGLEPADKTDFADWQQMVNTNILGLIHLTHEILPSMVANNDGYIIINLSSTAGNYPYFGGNVLARPKPLWPSLALKLACRFGR